MRTKHIFKVLALVLCIGAFALPTTAFAAGGKDTVPPSKCPVTVHHRAVSV